MTDEPNLPPEPTDQEAPPDTPAAEQTPPAPEASAAPGATEPSADFGDLGAQTATPAAGELSLLYDLTMPVAIELGRTRLSVREILSLGRGSVVQLERLAGEPIDVFVGDRRFAEGEVVVVGEQFGVRITRIVRPALGPAEEAQA